MQWEKRLDILGPMEQARRCLDAWLREEGRRLSHDQRQRAAALMARYFLHEEDVTDELMMSFLRHYSGKGAVDMEDPTSVRMEIKAVLDKSVARAPHRYGRWIAGGVICAAIVAWGVTHRPITREQQAELKELVHQVDVLDEQKTSAAIWNSVKNPLGVRRYDDMTWLDYHRSRAVLEKRLREFKPSAF